jgi:hypothetical protein
MSRSMWKGGVEAKGECVFESRGTRKEGNSRFCGVNGARLPAYPFSYGTARPDPSLSGGQLRGLGGGHVMHVIAVRSGIHTVSASCTQQYQPRRSN